jgi:NhaA family Na+:H+ antiporter
MYRVAVDSISRFLRLESAGGLVLIAAAVVALAVSNSPFAGMYRDLLSLPLEIRVGALELGKPLHLWIDDGLMAVFFLLVGLEIKRELLQGELSTVAQIGLPLSAAVGGMLVPAGLYFWLNHGDATAVRGWAIPMATDIAFALGIISLLGKRVPLSLKVFLTAIAIADDLGAILVIALVYTDHVSVPMLLLAGAAFLVLVALNVFRVRALSAYVFVGVFLWLFVLKSGIHATVAGVVLALTIPLRGNGGVEPPPLVRLEQGLHPWVAFGVLPIFAFANAGVALAGIGLATLFAPVPLGIVAGLVVGKLLGVFAVSAMLIKLGLARLPEESSWTSLLGIAALCGIGFTMSLFIGGLAFDEEGGHMQAVRLGVMCGSLISGGIGALFLVLGAKPAAPQTQLPSPGPMRRGNV